MISKAEECQCETKKCKCVGSLLRGKNYRHIDDEKDLVRNFSEFSHRNYSIEIGCCFC